MEYDPWYPIKAYKEISKWIIKFHSQKRCPNPCFRLELFKFMIDLDCSGMCDLKLFRKKVIITLFELCDNYKSLTLKQLPKFDPEDLKAILFKSNINIEYIINDLDLNKKKQNNTPIKDGTLPIC